MRDQQISRALRREHTEEVLVEAMATQVWALENDGQWRVAALHATPLGAAPLAVPH